jgi:hypothetical protein
VAFVIDHGCCKATDAVSGCAAASASSTKAIEAIASNPRDETIRVFNIERWILVQEVMDLVEHSSCVGFHSSSGILYGTWTANT